MERGVGALVLGVRVLKLQALKMNRVGQRRRSLFPEARRAGRLLLYLGIVPLFSSMGLAACKKNGAPTPVLAAAASTQAQEELRELEERWETESTVGRRDLRGDLEAFVAQYEGDPSVTRARILLAQIALLERSFGRAEEILVPLMEGTEGSAQDEATVIMAAIDNQRGNHEEALLRLEPLEGKLLKREAKDQYSRERSSAAIAARRWRLSMSVMIAWLVESEPETADVRRWIQSAIGDVPSRALSRLLDGWEEEKHSRKEEAARAWLHRLLILRLSDEALALRDPLLARDLLEDSPPWLRASKEGDELSLLASMAEKAAHVNGRAVGVVIGGDSAEKRRRSIRFASGMLRGLGLGLAKGDRKVRYIAVEDRGSIPAALGALTGLGASILVAGSDEAGAASALAFAEEREIPVVTLSEAPNDGSLKFGFVFGVGRTRQEEILAESLPEAKNWIFVGGKEHPCPSLLTSDGGAEASADLWKREGVDALGFLGGGGCVRQVFAQLSKLDWSPKVALGLEAAHEDFSVRLAHQWLQVGAFPLPKGGAQGDRMSALEERVTQGSEAPPLLQQSDWFFTLGVDVARLVNAALLTLPDTAVTRKSEVKARHKQAGDALLRARVPLISTTARGFSPDHLIDRTFSLSDLQKSGRVGAQPH